MDTEGLPQKRHQEAEGALAGMVLVGLLARRRTKLLPTLLIVSSFAVVAAGLVGCGGSGGSKTATTTNPSAPSTGTGSSTTGATPATYTFTLTGTDSVNLELSTSQQFVLTVN